MSDRQICAPSRPTEAGIMVSRDRFDWGTPEFSSQLYNWLDLWFCYFIITVGAIANLVQVTGIEQWRTFCLLPSTLPSIHLCLPILVTIQVLYFSKCSADGYCSQLKTSWGIQRGKIMKRGSMIHTLLSPLRRDLVYRLSRKNALTRMFRTTLQLIGSCLSS